jgi:hypothetical protein
MSQDAESQVIVNIKKKPISFFAIQLKKSTDIPAKDQLLAFSRFVCNGDITENFYFAKHSQKQQKAKTLLMLSTVISVLTICHGNRASASIRTVLPPYREA